MILYGHAGAALLFERFAAVRQPNIYVERTGRKRRSGHRFLFPSSLRVGAPVQCAAGRSRQPFGNKDEPVKGERHVYTT